MRYIYFNLGLMTIFVVENAKDDLGDLLGTSTIWDKAKPSTKKFIIASLIQNSSHKDIRGVTINDCDAPKPDPSNEQEVPEQ